MLSTEKAKFMLINIYNFYRETDLEDFKFILFHTSMIPQEIIDEYNLSIIMEDNGWYYEEIQKAMYGLKEAGYLANV